MTAIDVNLLNAYSRGEMSRRDIEDQLDQPVSFGALLSALQDNGLRLPRFPADPAKVALVRRLLDEADERPE